MKLYIGNLSDDVTGMSLLATLGTIVKEGTVLSVKMFKGFAIVEINDQQASNAILIVNKLNGFAYNDKKLIVSYVKEDSTKRRSSDRTLDLKAERQRDRETRRRYDEEFDDPWD